MQPPKKWVSIHATLAGGDPQSSLYWLFSCCFYPRHPRGWRRLSMPRKQTPPKFLSTPPSRVATKQAVAYGRTVVGFYPRHPRGWRQGAGIVTLRGITFLSTPPSRVATEYRVNGVDIMSVSIHATLAGGD